jgi:DNA-binding MarR family transcriptional regulator
MVSERHSDGGALVTALFLEAIRLNGSLTAEVDAMTADLGLTSARWQVLAHAAGAGRARTVSGIARRMGLSRQNVQRIADELAAADLVSFAPNPDHKRAKLVIATPEGRDANAAAHARQVRWSNGLGADVSPERLQAALTVLQTLRGALEQARASSDAAG